MISYSNTCTQEIAMMIHSSVALLALPTVMRSIRLLHKAEVAKAFIKDIPFSKVYLVIEV
jgi:hypothetical protein